MHVMDMTRGCGAKTLGIMTSSPSSFLPFSFSVLRCAHMRRARRCRCSFPLAARTNAASRRILAGRRRSSGLPRALPPALAAIPSTRAAYPRRRTPARTPIRRLLRLRRLRAPSRVRHPLAVSTENNPDAIPAAARLHLRSAAACPVDMAASISAAVTWAGAPAGVPPDPFPAAPNARRRRATSTMRSATATASTIRATSSRRCRRRATRPSCRVPSLEREASVVKSSATCDTSDVVVDTVPPKFPIPNAKRPASPTAAPRLGHRLIPAPEVRFPAGPRSGERLGRKKSAGSITIF